MESYQLRLTEENHVLHADLGLLQAATELLQGLLGKPQSAMFNLHSSLS